MHLFPFLVYALTGCREVSKVLESDQLQDFFEETTDALSGTYWVGFEHGGGHFGLGRFELEEGSFYGDVVSGDGYRYEFELALQEDGSLELADLETGDPADISFTWPEHRSTHTPISIEKLTVRNAKTILMNVFQLLITVACKCSRAQGIWSP